MTKVLIVDDHPLVRMGIRSYLETEEDMQVVEEATDGSQVVALAKALQPDVTLMDLFMPKVSGVEATAALKAEALACHVVIPG